MSFSGIGGAGGGGIEEVANVAALPHDMTTPQAVRRVLTNQLTYYTIDSGTTWTPFRVTQVMTIAQLGALTEMINNQLVDIPGTPLQTWRWTTANGWQDITPGGGGATLPGMAARQLLGHDGTAVAARTPTQYRLDARGPFSPIPDTFAGQWNVGDNVCKTYILDGDFELGIPADAAAHVGDSGFILITVSTALNPAGNLTVEAGGGVRTIDGNVNIITNGANGDVFRVDWLITSATEMQVTCAGFA